MQSSSMMLVSQPTCCMPWATQKQPCYRPEQKQELTPHGPAEWPGHQGSSSTDAAVRSKPHAVTLDAPNSLPKPLDRLSQHSDNWMAKLPQHCRRVMCPDANNLSPTALLSPYSVPLHPSKDGSDTRLCCHRATKLHPTGSTAPHGGWVPSLC